MSPVTKLRPTAVSVLGSEPVGEACGINMCPEQYPAHLTVDDPEVTMT
jgi:hypothetical protein